LINSNAGANLGVISNLNAINDDQGITIVTSGLNNGVISGISTGPSGQNVITTSTNALITQYNP